MDQPLSSELNSGSKQCWSCETTTPYYQGWCLSCWGALPPGVQEIVDILSKRDCGKYSGGIRMSISDSLKASRRPAPVYQPRVVAGKKALPSLKDLGF